MKLKPICSFFVDNEHDLNEVVYCCIMNFKF
jgi:hypothetical protein